MQEARARYLNGVRLPTATQAHMTQKPLLWVVPVMGVHSVPPKSHLSVIWKLPIFSLCYLFEIEVLGDSSEARCTLQIQQQEMAKISDIYTHFSK
jgi:hypothetical protein